MKTKTIFLILSLIFISCEKNMIEPISAFKINGDTISVIKIATADKININSKSINSDSLFWSFGDGRTSNDSVFQLSYTKSGTYTLTLTAKNKDGQTSISKKKIIVQDRVLKGIEIDNVDWDPTNLSEPWPRCDTVDVFFQMQMFTNDTLDANHLNSKCPILYTSSVVKNIHNHYTQKIYIPITSKIILEKNFVQFAPGNLNNAYLFSIMAKDSNGKLYRLANNAASGFAFGFLKDDISTNSCIISGGYLTNYKLICNFE